MTYFDQEQFDVRCEWGVPGVRHVASSDVIVVVDVLSFATSVDVARAAVRPSSHTAGTMK
jgi:2-phosphosulfolactate phosphatase